MRVRRLRKWASRALLAALMAFVPALLLLMPSGARADDAKPAAPAPVKFTNTLTIAPAEADKATEKSDAKKQADDKQAAKVGKEEAKVGVGEQLSFREEKVAEEMKELEDRMFRLAESLKAHEPENSSRLMLGLKYAREELILHQMAEVKAALAKLDLSDASTDQKQLLAKLERLQDLLLSPDLDFQMKLERLRQIREILRQLDGAIKEEDREQKSSDDLAEKEKQLEQLRKHHKQLAELVEEQKAHVGQGEKIAEKKDVGEPQEAAEAKLGKAQEATRQDTETFAKEKGGDSPNLGQATEKMEQAVKSLEAQKAAEALPSQQQALESLTKELEQLTKQQAQLEKELALEKFAALQKDQQGNRQTTDSISDLVRPLGDSGAGALSELIRASGSMSNAEGGLGNAKPGDASQDQMRALESLKYAKSQLEDEAAKLLDELRGEVKKRVLEGLTIMLEKQIAIRESTTSLGPRAKEGSRQALASVVGLSKSENKIIEIASDLITLVEETEFGIALPAALSVVRDEMAGVKTSLAAGGASEEVVNVEQQIEDDLKGLLDAMKRMPTSKGQGKNQKGGQSDQERELNRLVAELKMIRLLQVRLNGDTSKVDDARPAAVEELSTAVKKQINVLEERQDNIHDVTERLGAERGGEVNQQ